MYRNFIIALLAIAVHGSGDYNDDKDDPRGGCSGLTQKDKDIDYLNFVAKYSSRKPESTREMNKRKRRYQKSVEEIERINGRVERDRLFGARREPVRVAVNFTADMEDSEYEELLGLKIWGESLEANRGKLYKRGRRLNNGATDIDLVRDGKVTPVKDQGSCGSCWAFAATTQSEAALAIKNNTSPIRQSEQQLVDCTSNTKANRRLFGKTYGTLGCGGGWMTYAWNFQIDQGVMNDADYPYVAKDMRCRHDEAKIVGKPIKWERIWDDLDLVKETLEKTPMTLAINATALPFRYYKSGIIQREDCWGLINHAVVLVGLKELSNDQEPDEPEPEPELTCTVSKWWRECTIPDPQRLRMLQQDADEPYWLIQNSWGTGWGDNGFVRFAVEEGGGVCEMNAYIEYVEW